MSNIDPNGILVVQKPLIAFFDTCVCLVFMFVGKFISFIHDCILGKEEGRGGTDMYRTPSSMGSKSFAIAWYVNSCKKGATVSIDRSVIINVPLGRFSFFYSFHPTHQSK